MPHETTRSAILSVPGTCPKEVAVDEQQLLVQVSVTQHAARRNRVTKQTPQNLSTAWQALAPMLIARAQTWVSAARWLSKHNGNLTRLGEMGLNGKVSSGPRLFRAAEMRTVVIPLFCHDFAN